MEMAKYIYSILRSQLNILWSWGFNSPKAFANGLMFNVQGFIFNGWVKIIYNEGSDMFDIFLLNYQMVITKKIDGVYFDELVEVIDNAVEKVDNYESRVKAEYSL